MCGLCAAIPATLAIGVNLNAKQIRERREAENCGVTKQEKQRIPTGKIALILAGTLVVGSALYHSQFSG